MLEGDLYFHGQAMEWKLFQILSCLLHLSLCHGQ